MKTLLFESSFNILHLLIVFDFLGKFNGYKYDGSKKKQLFFSFLAFIFVFITISDRFTGFSEYSIFVLLFTLILYTQLSLNGRISKKIFSCILILFGHIIISTLLLFLGSVLFQKTVGFLIDNMTIYRIVICYATMLLLFIYSRVLVLLTKIDYKNTPRKIWWATLSIPFISIFTLALIMQAGINATFDRKVFLYLLISAIGVIFVNTLVFILFFKLSKEYENKTQIALLQKQLEHNNEIKDLYTQVQSIRHDFKNNLIYMQDCLTHENYNSLKDFVTKLNNDVTKTKKFLLTNSTILNSIINTKITQAFEHKINVTYTIPDNLSCPINESDFAVILGNLLDNAIEACENVDENKKIDISINQDPTGMHIELSNSIAQSVLAGNPSLKSSKPDRKNHGFGIKSVKKLVKNNHGLLDFYENDSCTVFYVHLYFQNTKTFKKY